MRQAVFTANTRQYDDITPMLSGTVRNCTAAYSEKGSVKNLLGRIYCRGGSRFFSYVTTAGCKFLDSPEWR